MSGQCNPVDSEIVLTISQGGKFSFTKQEYFVEHGKFVLFKLSYPGTIKTGKIDFNIHDSDFFDDDKFSIQDEETKSLEVKASCGDETKLDVNKGNSIEEDLFPTIKVKVTR